MADGKHRRRKGSRLRGIESVKPPSGNPDDGYFVRRQLLAKIAGLSATEKSVLDAISWRQHDRAWTYARDETLSDEAGFKARQTISRTCDKLNQRTRAMGFGDVVIIHDVPQMSSKCRSVDTNVLRKLAQPDPQRTFDFDDEVTEENKEPAPSGAVAEPESTAAADVQQSDRQSHACYSQYHRRDSGAPLRAPKLHNSTTNSSSIIPGHSTSRTPFVVDLERSGQRKSGPTLTQASMITIGRKAQQGDLREFLEWDRRLSRRGCLWPDDNESLAQRLALWRRCCDGKYRNGEPMNNPGGQYVIWHRAGRTELHNATVKDQRWAASVLRALAEQSGTVRQLAGTLQVNSRIAKVAEVFSA